MEDGRKFRACGSPRIGPCGSLGAAAVAWGWVWTTLSLPLKQPPRTGGRGGYEPGYASVGFIFRLLNALLQGTRILIFAGLSPLFLPSRLLSGSPHSYHIPFSELGFLEYD